MNILWRLNLLGIGRGGDEVGEGRDNEIMVMGKSCWCVYGSGGVWGQCFYVMWLVVLVSRCYVFSMVCSLFMESLLNMFWCRLINWFFSLLISVWFLLVSYNRLVWWLLVLFLWWIRLLVYSLFSRCIREGFFMFSCWVSVIWWMLLLEWLIISRGMVQVVEMLQLLSWLLVRCCYCCFVYSRLELSCICSMVCLLRGWFIRDRQDIINFIFINGFL